MIDVPEIQSASRGERGRIQVRGRCTDDGSWSTLLVIHKTDGAWTFHGLGAPGVTLSKVDTVALAKSILERAQPERS